MPHSNWKGVISFGLVAIPIVLYPAQNKEADISFHQIDKRDNARVKYQRINADTGKVVNWDDITRGYEYDKEVMIPVPDDVLKKVAGENARTINIDAFIDKNELDILEISNSYYLVPDKGGNKGYVILRNTLEETNKIGIAKVIISTKEYLSAVIPHQDALILVLLKYDTEVRKPSEFNLPDKKISDYKINKKEMEIAKKLVNSMTTKWHPEKYIDEYQQILHQWLEEAVDDLPHKAKMKQRSHAPSNVVNFVDLLKKSLASSAKGKKAVKTPIKKSRRTMSARHAVKH